MKKTLRFIVIMLILLIAASSISLAAPTKLVDGLGAPTGCRFLKNLNQLVFVEYSRGAISTLDMINTSSSILSQGSAVLGGTWTFDCETGTVGGGDDLWWEQIDTIKRQMTPRGGAGIVNLGVVSFASITPAILQTLPYGNDPIPGNNDATNQLVNGDVFAVKTSLGNLCKIQVVTYGYDLQINWVTYQLASPYHTIGLGYTTPEDIAVGADEKTAYVTERTGNLLKVNLDSANRAAATLVATGLVAPQQIFLDESHQQAYVVEYANPGHLYRINLITGQKTALLSNLNNAVGLLISSDLAYAYISEQSGGGRLTRYSLQGGANLQLAGGLINPFYLTWANDMQDAIYVAERDPANRITLVGAQSGGARQVVTNTGVRPSSVAVFNDTNLLICCNSEIDKADVLAGFTPGLFKGIGLVPWNLITAAGKADTTSQPLYPYQFAKDSPFGGNLSLQINHLLAWQSGIRYYRILVDAVPRLDTWYDLQLNSTTGKYDIPVLFKPRTIGVNTGCYSIHPPTQWLMNTDLGMILNSTTLANGKRIFTIEFLNSAGALVQSQSLPVWIDNNHCTASIDMPLINGTGACPECGMLSYNNDKTQILKISYVATHPNLFATYSWRLGRASYATVPGVPESSVNGVVSLAPFLFQKDVGSLLGTCPGGAFHASVYVYAKAINGYGRLSQYDASRTIAFALTPTP
jgi:hypothetical protein